MDVKALDKTLQEIVKRRMELQTLDYSNPRYDDLEEQLHDLEDGLQEAHGKYLENVLQDIHDKHFPDSDVLYPIAYLAKTYSVNDKNEYVVSGSEGVYVESDEYTGKETRLVIVPNPTRVVLNIGIEKQEVLWEAN